MNYQYIPKGTFSVWNGYEWMFYIKDELLPGSDKPTIEEYDVENIYHWMPADFSINTDNYYTVDYKLDADGLKFRLGEPAFHNE